MIRKAVSVGLAASMLYGCATSYTTGGGVDSRHYFVQEKNVEYQETRFYHGKSRAKDLESLLDSVESLSENVEKSRRRAMADRKHYNKYKSMLEHVDSLVQDRQYAYAEKKIRKAVGRLRREDFSTRDRFLDVFRNYSYIRADYISPVVRETRKAGTDSVIKGILELPIAIGLGLVALVLHEPDAGQKVVDHAMENFEKKNVHKRTIKKGHYKVYKITPYYGKEKFLGTYDPHEFYRRFKN